MNYRNQFLVATIALVASGCFHSSPGEAQAQPPPPPPHSNELEHPREDPEVRGDTSEGAIAREAFERIAKLETKAEGERERISDLRNLLFVLFGVLVTVLCAIGAPLIFRERRERRELRETADLEREKLDSKLKQSVDRIDKQISDVHAEMELVREGLVSSLRSQMVTMKQEFEGEVASKRDEVLQSTPQLIASRAYDRLETRLTEYTKTLETLRAAPSAIDYILRARFYLSQGGHESASRAAAEAERALEIEPNNCEAMVLLARAELERSEPHRAYDLLEHVIAECPDNEEALMFFCDAASKLERFERVADLGERLLDEGWFSNLAWLVSATAGALLRLNRSEQAVGLLVEYIEGHPEASQVRARLVEMLLKQERAQEARKLAEEGLRLNPADHQMRRLHARIVGEVGDIDEAVAELNEVALRNPRDIKIYLTEANLLRENGRFEGAIEACEQGLRNRGPSGLRALLYINLAQSLSRVGRSEEAVAASRRSVELGSNYILNHLILLESLLCAGKFSEGLAAADEASNFASTPETEALVGMFSLLFGVLGSASESQQRGIRAQLDGALESITQRIRWDFDFIRQTVETLELPASARREVLDVVASVESARSSPRRSDRAPSNADLETDG